MIRKIIINFIFIFIVLLLFDMFIFYKVWKGTPYFSHKSYLDSVIFTMPVDKYFDNLYAGKNIDKAYSSKFRPDKNINSSLKPILFMGCSFTYGIGINEDETISSKTAKLTNRPIYNRAGPGWGLDQLIYQLRRKDLITTIPEPEFLIYTFINDHFARIDKYKPEPVCGEFQPHYEKDFQNGVLKELKPKLWHYPAFVEYILYEKYYIFANTDEKKSAIIKLYFNEAYKAMKKYWKNTKFVILLYPTSKGEDDFFNNFCWKELEKDFIVIDINKLTNKDMEKYKCEDGWHPSPEAWDIILDKLLDYLSINKNQTN